jgi:alpha-mannosidase
MQDWEKKLIVSRVSVFLQRLKAMVQGPDVPLGLTVRPSRDPVPFAGRLDLPARGIAEGETWGQAWDSAWFEAEGTVPEHWRGERVIADLDFNGEACVFSPEGVPIGGLSSHSVFERTFRRNAFCIADACRGGERVRLWIEAAANELIGIELESDPAQDSPARYGVHVGRVNRARLCVLRLEVWRLMLDVQVLFDLAGALPERSVRRARILRALSDACNVFRHDPENAQRARAVLRPELEKPATASALTVTAVGHAHIDTGWLWPVRETIRKCARTFATQLALLDRYPEYVFGASQAQHYVFMQEHYPALFDAIRRQVEAGRWEVQGAMWVEADCNLTGGEALVRQILYGKNYFRDTFGVDVRNLWLPDVFGYSAALPQILRRSGVDAFVTQKMSWNETNLFPHHTFRWRGIDGSEVVTHFPPEDTYNSTLSPASLAAAAERFTENDRLDGFLSLFGIGDGGGGPREEDIERGLRQRDLEGAPRVVFGRADTFCAALLPDAEHLPAWEGELYLELHRGTLTTQARTKRGNRRCEQRLRAVEWLSACLAAGAYPRAELDRLWQRLLLNQFHDILPGSSIGRVYAETERDHAEILAGCDALIDAAAGMLFTPDPDAAVLVNILSHPYRGAVTLPESWREGGVRDAAGAPIAAQREDGRLVAHVTVPAQGSLTLRRDPAAAAPALRETGTDRVLENARVRYTFDADAGLVGVYDKELNAELLAHEARGNVLTLYHDYARNWDAWDIERPCAETRIADARVTSAGPVRCGPARCAWDVALAVGHSTIRQRIVLAADSKRLDFETRVDWREKHRMLRVAFPVDSTAEQARFDIQYGYVARPTHTNTSWDAARFEVAGHRYADVSEADRGVALLNDCKYGYRVQGSVLDLNLLRSPTHPDPDADQGEQVLTYSLLPHAGDLVNSDVMAEAACLNQGVVLCAGFAAPDGVVPPCRVEGDGLSLEVLKRAERSDACIARVVETRGRHARGRLVAADAAAVFVETDLMEWTELAAPAAGAVALCLRPFEIRTYMLKRT